MNALPTTKKDGSVAGGVRIVNMQFKKNSVSNKDTYNYDFAVPEPHHDTGLFVAHVKRNTVMKNILIKQAPDARKNNTVFNVKSGAARTCTTETDKDSTAIKTMYLRTAAFPSKTTGRRVNELMIIRSAKTGLQNHVDERKYGTA